MQPDRGMAGEYNVFNISGWLMIGRNSMGGCAAPMLYLPFIDSLDEGGCSVYINTNIKECINVGEGCVCHWQDMNIKNERSFFSPKDTAYLVQAGLHNSSLFLSFLPICALLKGI